MLRLLLWLLWFASWPEAYQAAEVRPILTISTETEPVEAHALGACSFGPIQDNLELGCAV